jgi:hypothetical protein
VIAKAPGKEKKMATLTRRSVLCGSVGVAAAGALARPHVANASATTAELWWQQRFAQEEDIAFRPAKTVGAIEQDRA